MSDKSKCPKCGAAMVSYGSDSDHGPHDVDGERCLRRQLQQKDAYLEHAMDLTGLAGVDEPLSLHDAIVTLKKRIAELEDENKDLRDGFGHGVCDAQLAAVNRDNATLKADNDRLRAIRKFLIEYAEHKADGYDILADAALRDAVEAAQAEKEKSDG